MLLGEHDARDGAGVNREGLEELRALPHRLRVLDDHTHRPRTRTVRDLDPVTTERCNVQHHLRDTITASDQVTTRRLGVSPVVNAGHRLPKLKELGTSQASKYVFGGFT